MMLILYQIVQLMFNFIIIFFVYGIYKNMLILNVSIFLDF